MLADGEEANLQSQLYTARQLVTELVGMDSKLSGVLDMLEEAAIQLSEASDELRHYNDRLDLDPNRLFELEQRISRQIALARKHQITPEELPAFYQGLLEEQRLLDDSAGSLESLSQTVIEHHQLALETAQQLHALRQTSAQELAQLITESMRSLSRPHGVFAIEVAFDERHLTAEGADRIEFRVTTNPGQPLQPIAKVASGGELSRIALAIQVITARKMETPALIFDEVDVGISGPTAGSRSANCCVSWRIDPGHVRHSPAAGCRLWPSSFLRLQRDRRRDDGNPYAPARQTGATAGTGPSAGR